MSVYQQIKDKFIMKNAWDDWADYRAHLTDIILEAGPKRVMIVGAGRCCDIDLLRVASKADRVICLDVDEEALQSAVMKLPAELKDKVEIRRVSLTGIKESDMEKFCERMLLYVRQQGRELTSDSFKTELIRELEELRSRLIRNEEDLRTSIPERSADTVVCCGVYSQLFSMLSFFIRSLIGSLHGIMPDADMAEADSDKIIRDMNDHVIPIINNVLREAAENTVIFGNEYIADNPVEGAVQCINYVRKTLNPTEQLLKWEFNKSEGTIYDMLIQICEL